MERDLERSGMSAVDTAVTFNDLPPVPPLPVSREEKVNYINNFNQIYKVHGNIREQINI